MTEFITENDYCTECHEFAGEDNLVDGKCENCQPEETEAERELAAAIADMKASPFDLPRQERVAKARKIVEAEG